MEKTVLAVRLCMEKTVLAVRLCMEKTVLAVRCTSRRAPTLIGEILLGHLSVTDTCYNHVNVIYSN